MPVDLAKYLSEHFNNEELNDLCDHLSIDPENIPGKQNIEDP
jgi:hypothetical protein